ncbi:hypothetical protein D9M72_571390 [compost metagenome]
MRDTRLDRQSQGLGVHVGDHQKLTVPRIRDDSRDQPLFIEARGEGRTGFQFSLVGGGSVEGERHGKAPSVGALLKAPEHRHEPGLFSRFRLERTRKCGG